MSLYSFCESLENTSLLTHVRETPWVYPVIMSTHLICIAVFGGMILMTDLRLLGVALRDLTIAEVVDGLRPYKRIGFVIMVTCGLLMAGSEAPKYYVNPFFWTKMTLLALVGVHALIFKSSVYDHPEELDKSPVLPIRAKAAAVFSLILWVSLPIWGRMIAYYEPEDEKPPKTATALCVPAAGGDCPAGFKK